MLKEHDERAKLIAEQTLDLLGEVQREVEIPTADAPRIDLWLRRLRRPAVLPSFLRLLDALFPEDAMIEVYSEAVRLVSFYESHHKQYAWRRYLSQRPRDQAAPAAPGTCEPSLQRPPWLWLLSTGRPETLFAEYPTSLRQRPDLPAGIYDFGAGWRIGLVVLSELPAGPGAPEVTIQTLVLRLMGSPAVRRAALAELHGLPTEHPDTPQLLRLVASLRHTFKRATTISDEDKDELMTAAWAEFEQYEQRIRREGRQDGLREGRQDGLREGRQDGLREGRQEGLEGRRRDILKFCATFQIATTEEQVQRLQQMDADALSRLFDQLLTTRSWP